jgi:hypothetical protein
LSQLCNLGCSLNSVCMNVEQHLVVKLTFFKVSFDDFDTVMWKPSDKDIWKGMNFMFFQTKSTYRLFGNFRFETESIQCAKIVGIDFSIDLFLKKILELIGMVEVYVWYCELICYCFC